MLRAPLTTVLAGLIAASTVFALPQSPSPGTASSPDDQAPKPPACLVETIQLGSVKDGSSLAKTLGTLSREFLVTPDPKKSETLYVIDREAARQPDACKCSGWKSTRAHKELDDIIALLDRDYFDGVDLNSNFFISVSNEGLRRAIIQNFQHPSQGIQLLPISAAGYNLLVTPAPGQESGASTLLPKQAAGIKHDLELLDAQAAFDGLGQTIGSTEREAEFWFAQHTVELAVLDPRDVALKLGRFYHSRNMDIQVRTGQHAVTFLPQNISKSDPLYLTADAIERNVLIAQKQQYEKDLAAQQASGNKKTSNSAPPAATTKSTTTTTVSPASGKTPAKTTTETSTTIQTSSPGAPASQGQSSSGSTSSSSSQSQSGTAVGSGAGAGGSGGGGGSTNGTSGASSGNSGGNGPGGGGASPSSSGTSQQRWELDHIVRLYHFRHASAIATAINKASGSKGNDLVEPLAEDLLLILPPQAGQPDRSMSIRRGIALIDLPRPQLSLQVWSYQISSESKDGTSSVQKAFMGLRKDVMDANEAMTGALQRGVGYLSDQVGDDPDILDPDFRRYLTGRYEDCVAENIYCLGYYDALAALSTGDSAGDRAMNASLGRLLLFLAALRDDRAATAVNAVIRCMEFASCAGNLSPMVLDFPRFHEQLTILSDQKNLHILREALLDFLFQYKWTVVYPNDFVPYDIQRSAHTLDGLFAPIIDAFNQDVDKFVDAQLENRSRQETEVKAFASRGMVQVAALSGTQAMVAGKVNNYFDITPPLSLNDILNTGNQANIASSLKNVLEPKEILILQGLANIGSQPRITAEVSRDTTLTITPTALDTASSAELDTDFDVKDDTAPQTVNQSSAQKDLLDRVAEHHVTTHIRVESLKLFQVSAFTMDLTHPQRGVPIPVVGWGWQAIFGTTPGLSKLFVWPRGPKTIDNRSVAIVRAVVVPTAMDLGLSLRFESDRIVDPITNATTPMFSGEQIGGKIRRFHKNLMQCVRENRDNEGNPLASGTTCLDSVTLSDTNEDLR